MALSFTTIGSGLQRLSGSFMSPPSSYTYSYWLQLTITPSTNQRVYSIIGDPAGTSGYSAVSGSSTNNLYLGVGNLSTTMNTIATVNVLVPYVWNHVAVTYNNATKVSTLYLNGTAVATITLDLSGTAYNAERLGFSQTTPLTGLSIAYYRSWNGVVLTATQVKLEMASATAVKTSGLLVDTPLQDTTTTGLADNSPNNLNWALIGSATEVTSLQIGMPPTNTSPATALVIEALPVGMCQNVNTGTAQNVWYSYTAQSTDTVISAWAFGDLSIYTPQITVYDGIQNALSQVSYLPGLEVLAYDAILQFGTIPGHTYYIKAIAPMPNASPAVLVFSVVQVAHTTGAGHIHSLQLPAGLSIASPADYLGGPLIWVSGTTGRTLRGLPAFPGAWANSNNGNQESAFGHVLRNGITAVAGNLNPTPSSIFDVSGVGLYLYDQNYLPMGGAVNLSFPSNTICGLSSDRIGTFYVAGFTGTNSQVTTVSAQTGLQGKTIWQPTFVGGTSTGQILGMAPSLNNTLLYYTGQTADTRGEGVVRVWDLVNNVAKANFATAPANHDTANFVPGGILVLADSTVLVSYEHVVATTDSIVVQYTPAGTVVQTITFAGVRVLGIAHAIDDPLSFWIGFQRFSDGYVQWQRLSTVTGLVTADTGPVMYSFGGYPAELVRPGPTSRVSPALGSQFWVPPVSPASNLIVPTQWQIHRLDVKPTSAGHR